MKLNHITFQGVFWYIEMQNNKFGNPMYLPIQIFHEYYLTSLAVRQHKLRDLKFYSHPNNWQYLLSTIAILRDRVPEMGYVGIGVYPWYIAF